MTKTSQKTVAVTATAILEKQHPLRAIRRAGVPLVAFETSDPAMTMASCMKALNGKITEIPVMRWDFVRGLVGLNDRGALAAAAVSPDPALTCNPVECLGMLASTSAEKVGTNSTVSSARAKKLEKALCFFMGANHLISQPGVIQAIWNLRDEWKSQGATLVLLCPSMRLPDELAHDIVVVTEPLPNAVEVQAIVDSVAKDAGITENESLKDPAEKQKIVDTLLGMSAFAAEQVFAMSITRDGNAHSIDRSELWERKRKMVEQTPGLSIWRGKESFADIGGLDNIKDYLTRILTSGRNPVNAILFVDEIEKLFAGSSGDLSGVSQDQLRVFLTTMQDENLPGIILIGPPGAGKSALAKGAGRVVDAEVLSCDTGAMTGSLVGESQAKIRKAMQVFSAVSQGKGLVIATCNSISSLPPELRRRFSLGTFFVDLPTLEERATIWPIWLKKYDLPLDSKRPNDDGWTGAEIKACCDVSFRAGLSLQESSEFIVPVSRSAADKIEALRRSASERFVSASKKGLYVYNPDKPAAVVTAGGRKFDN